MITAYYAGGTPDEIKHSGNGVATILFQNAFQNKSATKFLNVMVALSAYGHLVTAVLSHSRGLRECGRQGVLPFPKFWTSTKPFGTPLGPILVTWIVNFIMIVAPPAGSAFNLIVDMGSYSGYIFTLALISTKTWAYWLRCDIFLCHISYSNDWLVNALYCILLCLEIYLTKAWRLRSP